MGVSPDRTAVLSPYLQNLVRFKACQLCRKPGFSRSDKDDLVQHLTLCLLQKAHLYDPDRGASADTFAGRVVNSAVKMLLRDRGRQRRAAGFTAMSLDTGTVQVRGRHVPIRDLVGDADARTERSSTDPAELLRENDEAVAKALSELEPHLAEIARRLRTISVAKVAKEMGVSRRRVYAALVLIRRRFEAKGFGKS